MRRILTRQHFVTLDDLEQFATEKMLWINNMIVSVLYVDERYILIYWQMVKEEEV